MQTQTESKLNTESRCHLFSCVAYDTSRLAGIDMFRGLGILIMIMGHIGFGSDFSHFVHAFHVPMFFFAAGYLFNINRDSDGRNSPLAFIGRKAKSLLLPYLLWSMVALVSEFFAANIRQRPFLPLRSLSQIFWINNNEFPISGALWFLTALFFVSIMAYVLFKFLPKWVAYLSAISIAVLGTFFPLQLPWSINSAFVGLGFFVAARFLGENRDKSWSKYICNLRWYILLPLVALNVYMTFVNDYVNMRQNFYSIVPLFWFNAFAMIIVSLNLINKIVAVVGKSKVRPLHRFKNAFCYVGQYSMIFVCINQIIILSLQGVADFLIGTEETPIYWFAKVIILILTLTICTIANNILMKTSLRKFLAK